MKGAVELLHIPSWSNYTDEARAYQGLPFHQAVKHSEAMYVQGDAHTNGVESFWSMLKRAHKGTSRSVRST